MNEEIDSTQLPQTFDRAERPDESFPPGSEHDTPSLTRAAAQGMAWTWAAVIGTLTMQLVYTAVMSRKIAPGEFGLVAAALVGLRFVSYLSNFGLGSAVVQRPHLGEREISIAVVLSAAIGVLVAALAVLLSPILSDIVDEPDAGPVMRWLAIGLFFGAIATVPDGLLRRRLRFRSIALAQLTSFAVGNLSVGIPLAYRGWGVWSLVTATIVQSGVMLGLFALAAHPPVRHGFSWKVARELLTFGGTVSVIGFLAFLRSSLDTLAVGRWVGARGLGQYSRGTYLVALPVEYATMAMSRVLLPAFSRVQTQRQRFVPAFVRSTGVAAVLVMTLVASAACAAPALVALVLGPGWSDAARVLPIVGIAHGLAMLTHFPAIAAESQGSLRPKLVIEATTLMVLFTSIVAVGLTEPTLIMFASCWLLAEAARFVLYWVIVLPLLGVKRWDLGRRYLASLAVAVSTAFPMFAAVRVANWSGLFVLAASVVLGAAVGVGITASPIGNELRGDAAAIRHSL